MKKKSNEPRKFVFIAHYVETWNWLLNFRAFQFLHEDPLKRRWLWPLYPLCWVASLIYMMGRKPFQVVDTYSVNMNLVGHTILIRNFGWHFLFPWYRKTIRRRILASVRHAQDELHADVIGLGALTKAEWLTQGGKWITDQDNIRVPIVHGDTATAWCVIEQLKGLIANVGGNPTIALIGPTSKIGRAIMLALAPQGVRFKAFTSSRERFVEIQDELPSDVRKNIEQAVTMRELRECKIWVTGKAKPAASELIAAIPQGATVLNFSVPNPMTSRDMKKRPDAQFLEEGLVHLQFGCTMHFTMRLPRGLTYACTTGTMIHASKGWTQHEVGEVDMAHMERVGQAFTTHGFKLQTHD